jgi:hypothetical protein
MADTSTAINSASMVAGTAHAPPPNFNKALRMRLGQLQDVQFLGIAQAR